MGAEQRQCPRGFFNRSALLSRSRHVLQCNARRLVRQAEEEESSDWSREVNKIRSRRHTTIRNNPGRKVDTLFPFRYFIIVHFWISPIILFIYLQLGFLSTTGHLRAFTHQFSGLDDIRWIVLALAAWEMQRISVNAQIWHFYRRALALLKNNAEFLCMPLFIWIGRK